MAWMIYGANGYTGELTAREAVRRGMQPVLAGRNGPAVEALAQELGLSSRIFDLSQMDAESLADLSLVLHCAGPFSETSAPMLEACLAAGVHYLDITGEISVFKHAWEQHERACKADIVVCPGVGFAVVPTDCLAASLVQALPAATHLTLAFEAGGGPSRGTAKTGVEGLGRGGMIRRDGELVTVPLGWRDRLIPFAKGERQAVTIPWGDVFTAWVSTGVPNIEVYLSTPPAAITRLRRLAKIQPVLRWRWVQERLKRKIEAGRAGPSDTGRENSGVEVWGEVVSADGRRAQATLSGPNGYDVTVTASLGVIEGLLAGQREGGFYTPSLLMGADFAASLPQVTQSPVELISD